MSGHSSKKDSQRLLENNKYIHQLEERIRLLESENNSIKHILEILPGDIYWKNKQGIWSGLNKRCAQSLQKMGFLKNADINEVIGKSDFQLFDKKTAEIFRQNDNEVLNKGIEISREEMTLLPSGEYRALLSTKRPMLDDEGQIIGVIGNTIDVTHLKRLEQDLRIAKEKAEAASIAKTAFIANMSHDIRTPLSGVIGLSEILEHGLSNAQQKEQAHMLHDSGEELLNMLNDILDDVRADHLSENDIQEEAFDLHHCIEELVRLELPTTTLKNLKLAVDIAMDVPKYIISDRKKIHRILLNLLGNAIKFTLSGQITIELKCLSKDQSKVHLQFGVSDTGVGIPQELQDKVFDRFFRVTPSYKGLYSGHGLGLHIVQSYVSLLGGHITLTSKEGIGSTFHFDLSCALIQGPFPVYASVIPNNEISPTLVPNSTHHILLVEDNPLALRVLETMAHNCGYTTDSAKDGEHGLQLAQSKHFDLIITDIGLPGISGHALAQEIRAWEKKQYKPHTRIVGLTGHAEDTTRQECLKSGVDEVYCKPITQSILKEIVSCIPTKKNVYAKKKQAGEKVALGADLPQTEKELFQLESYELFSPKDALEHLTMPLLFEMAKVYTSNDFQHNIQELKQAHEKQSWDEIEHIAHKIKGGVSYIGAKKMRYACQYLERYHLAGHTALREELYQQLIKTNELTLQAIKEWLIIYDEANQ